MPKINYVDIFKKSWAITWRNKYLWWFGFFLALSGSGSAFNYSSKNDESASQIGQRISDLFTSHGTLVISAGIIVLLLIIFFLAMGVLSRGGLIISLEKITRGEKTNFRTGLREGKKYFWRIFLIGFLIGIAAMIIMALIITPIIFLFVTRSFILGSLLILAGIIILIPLFILAFFLKQYAFIYATAGNLPPFDSLENAYELFRKNMGPSIIMSLFFIPVGLIVGLAVIFALFFLSMIFFPLGLLLYFTLGKIATAIFAGLAALILLVLIIVARSAYETFYQTAWLLFFHEIASLKITEVAVEAEKKAVPEIKPAATPDAA